MSAIKGTWKINSVGDVTGVIEQEVNCTSGGKSFVRIQVFTGYVALHDADSTGVFMVFNNGVLDETYQNINFGTTEQTVKDSFYTWLVANAEQVENTEDGGTDSGGDDGGDTGSGDTETGSDGAAGSDDTESGGTDDDGEESTGSDVSKIEVGGKLYTIKDKEARTIIESLSKRISVYENLLAEIENALSAI